MVVAVEYNLPRVVAALLQHQVSTLLPEHLGPDWIVTAASDVEQAKTLAGQMDAVECLAMLMTHAPEPPDQDDDDDVPDHAAPWYRRLLGLGHRPATPPPPPEPQPTFWVLHQPRGR